MRRFGHLSTDCPSLPIYVAYGCGLGRLRSPINRWTCLGTELVFPHQPSLSQTWYRTSVPTPAIFEPKPSLSALTWSAEYKSLSHSEVTCYWRGMTHWSRCGDTLMVPHGCGQRTSSWGMRFSAQDELFIKRNTVSDEQVASATKESA